MQICKFCGPALWMPAGKDVVKEMEEQVLQGTKAYIVRAWQPGDIVLLQAKRAMNSDQIRQMSLQIEKIAKDVGIKFILLPENVEVVMRVEEQLQQGLITPNEWRDAEQQRRLDDDRSSES